ncbi:hypothetical protein GCM10011445_42690 [Pseudocitrobacter faecalis]|uniref:Uncharacterized protein n=1 Tax=Pseudocitrobacter faecalis TaxID=1398493 RepID=A0ABX9FSU8_9ENTR|nr:hypothetical protein DFQ50_11531 [Pseudocitrobacter faecalis]GHD97672.1 hypothetical protein GCM10011445_42690 [Pseudocitrobacter faecalis]
MCEQIRFARIIVFFIIFLLIVISVVSGMRFCKKKGIDFNTFTGIFEMYAKVFRFEDKIFSVLMLICIYGGALLMLITICVSFWAEGQGCVFPTQYNKY